MRKLNDIFDTYISNISDIYNDTIIKVSGDNIKVKVEKTGNITLEFDWISNIEHDHWDDFYDWINLPGNHTINIKGEYKYSILKLLGFTKPKIYFSNEIFNYCNIMFNNFYGSPIELNNLTLIHHGNKGGRLEFLNNKYTLKNCYIEQYTIKCIENLILKNSKVKCDILSIEGHYRSPQGTQNYIPRDKDKEYQKEKLIRSALKTKDRKTFEKLFPIPKGFEYKKVELGSTVYKL